MAMTREETLLAKRFIDLSRQAQQKNIVLFSEIFYDVKLTNP